MFDVTRAGVRNRRSGSCLVPWILAIVMSGCSAASASQGTVAQATASPPLAPASASAAPSPSGGSPGLSLIPNAGPLKLLWQHAAQSTIRTETYWPAIDPLTGDVWVASSFENKYWIYKPDGTLVGEWGTSGAGDGELALTTHDPNPDGVGAIAFAPDGSFFVADNGNYRVEAFDKDGRYVTQWGHFGTDDGAFLSPKGIATDGKVVYVNDDPRADIQVFDTSGRFLRKFPVPGSFGVHLAPNGDLIHTNNMTNEVELLDPTGRLLTAYPVDFPAYHPEFPQSDLPTGGADAVMDRAGRLFVCLEDGAGPVGLLELDPAGHVVGRWSSGCETMALAPDGSAVYMAFTNIALSGWPFFKKFALPKG